MENALTGTIKAIHGAMSVNLVYQVMLGTKLKMGSLLIVEFLLFLQLVQLFHGRNVKPLMILKHLKE